MFIWSPARKSKKKNENVCAYLAALSVPPENVENTTTQNKIETTKKIEFHFKCDEDFHIGGRWSRA